MMPTPRLRLTIALLCLVLARVAGADDELCWHHDDGYQRAKQMQAAWQKLDGEIDPSASPRQARTARHRTVTGSVQT